ncbi:hypothetical protein JG687_00012250 [Phytophthora cactorum]|uniref:Uncharacterized protein n=1 Tax=Phytophthora cactorum TaxID=29920 RepID=A0A8T1U4U8_9STRA|nr:hypothetical protein JG687_00012250 [Phytophthora cactorum]
MPRSPNAKDLPLSMRLEIRRSNRGRPHALIDGVLKAKIEAAPVEGRTMLRGLAASTGVARTQIFRRLKERSVAKRVTVVPKPLLTPEQMEMRRQFARSFVEKLHDKKLVLIQQDNAPPHRASGLTAVKAAAATDVLDLGWFNPLQSLQYNKQTRDVDRLIEAVCAAFDEMDSAITNKCFLTLKRVLQASMLVRGINSYDIAHLKKDALIRAGKLPRCLSCSAEAMQMSL